jgi:hypothetical protein
VLDLGCSQHNVSSDELIAVNITSRSNHELFHRYRRRQVREASSKADRAFALLRTMELMPDVHRLLSPCIGEIRLVRGDARRFP